MPRKQGVERNDQIGHFDDMLTIGQVVQKAESEFVLQSEQMSNTITVRLPEDLAGWLEATSKKAGVPRGRIIREQLELARRRHDQPFLHLAGSVEGPRDLSARKGFAKK
jgi:predicted DNA binding CopG/RHH family protein